MTMARVRQPSGGGPRLAAVTAALLVALLPVVAGCGGEGGGGGDGSGESRFSIGGRGLNEAVDSVRSSRRRTPTGGMGGGSDASRRSSLPPEIQSALDSGNVAYRAGNYRAALEQFESLAEEHPDVRAAWFGIFMAHRALGNTAAADSAMRRAGMGSSDATDLHGSAADSGTSTAPHPPMTDTTDSPI